MDNYSDDFEEKDNKVQDPHKKQEPAPQEKDKKKGNLLEDFDDDDDDTDPWNLDSKNKKSSDNAKATESKQPAKP